MTIDYRELNKVTLPIFAEVPHIDLSEENHGIH